MKALFTLLLTMLVAGIVYSQPGTLDLTFGTDGFVADTEGISGHYAVLQQSNGKLVTAGGYNDKDFNGKGNLARYLLDGTLDSSFGTNGYAGYPPGGGINDMIKQPDGKILVVGLLFIDLDNNIERSFVARFNPDGTYDSSFGKNGFSFIPDFGDASGYIKIALETDGSSIISGSGSDIHSQSTLPQYSLLCHLSADGTFDYSFGNGGRALVSGNAIILGFKTGLAIQKDGSILQAGYNYLASEGGQEDYVLSRYLPNGSLDNSFGTNGTVTTAGVEGLIAADFPCGIVVQPDGKIVMGGTSPGYNYITYMAALRYNTDGSLDNSFGKGGRALTSFPGYTPTATAILMQPDGKLILTGDAAQISVQSGFALCRLNTDGSVDTSFGISGREVAFYSGSVDVTGYCAALQSDGKIAVGGFYYDEDYNPHSLLARFNGDEGGKPLLVRIKRWLNNHGVGWQGLDSKNISYYSVQYSKTGSGFAETGKVSGSSSSSFQQYSYDVTDAGYYRVVAVDNKGYKTFSNKVELTATDIAFQASVYPNPAKDYLTVQGLPATETANISISDGNGNVKAKGVSNGAQYRSQLTNLQPGTYYVNITTGAKTETLKFVKE